MTFILDGVSAKMALDAPVAGEVASGDVVVAAAARVGGGDAGSAGSVTAAVVEREISRD